MNTIETALLIVSMFFATGSLLVDNEGSYYESNIRYRVLIHMNKGKEPKGHCEAMVKRQENILIVFNKNLHKLKENK